MVSRSRDILHCSREMAYVSIRRRSLRSVPLTGAGWTGDVVRTVVPAGGDDVPRIV